MTTKKLKTIRQFSEENPAFPPAGLRQLRFYGETNGFAVAFLTIGRKVLIDEDKFFEIVEGKNPHRHALQDDAGAAEVSDAAQ